jgi:hypothetical protein
MIFCKKKKSRRFSKIWIHLPVINNIYLGKLSKAIKLYQKILKGILTPVCKYTGSVKIRKIKILFKKMKKAFKIKKWKKRSQSYPHLVQKIILMIMIMHQNLFNPQKRKNLVDPLGTRKNANLLEGRPKKDKSITKSSKTKSYEEDEPSYLDEREYQSDNDDDGIIDYNTIKSS